MEGPWFFFSGRGVGLVFHFGKEGRGEERGVGSVVLLGVRGGKEGVRLGFFGKRRSRIRVSLFWERRSRLDGFCWVRGVGLVGFLGVEGFAWCFFLGWSGSLGGFILG